MKLVVTIPLGPSVENSDALRHITVQRVKELLADLSFDEITVEDGRELVRRVNGAMPEIPQPAEDELL